MQRKPFDINTIRVASRCSVAWETMKGDERARHCSLCKLNVYNISALTTNEARDMIVQREGRLCIRFYRRVDGTVLTADCPVGLRAMRRRAARFTTAVFAAVLGLFSVSFGQRNYEKEIDAKKTKIVRTFEDGSASQITGVLTDPNGAVVPGIVVRLSSGDSSREVTTNSEGVFKFDKLTEGRYSFSAGGLGFAVQKFKNLVVNNGEKLQLTIELHVDPSSVTMGIFGLDDEITVDPTSSTVQKTLNTRKISLIPHE